MRIYLFILKSQLSAEDGESNTGRVKQKGRNGESVVARGRWHFSLRKRREWRRRERTERRAELSGEAAVPLTRVKGPCACIHHLCPRTAHPAPFETDLDLGGDTHVWFSNWSDSLADPVLEGGGGSSFPPPWTEELRVFMRFTRYLL